MVTSIVEQTPMENKTPPGGGGFPATPAALLDDFESLTAQIRAVERERRQVQQRADTLFAEYTRLVQARSRVLDAYFAAQDAAA